ncbi:hypothetical protein [Ruegeria pomeroyi]|uniref:hypothetical protein n=1 Tax=Ruegeria pomeroyi TaxID=89184 RepID=UPI001F395E22|nr:hypothetical protein [Ruegeria pomeroyi]
MLRHVTSGVARGRLVMLKCSGRTETGADHHSPAARFSRQTDPRRTCVEGRETGR